MNPPVPAFPPRAPQLPRRAFLTLLLGAAAGAMAVQPGPVITSSLTLEELSGSKFWPQPLRSMIAYALSLTLRGLGYQFGSSDPEEGGMDCSGTMNHVMRHQGIKNVPRQSDSLYTWVEKAGLMRKVSGTPALDDPVLSRMKPGDLLFWTGTYDTGSRTNPISHVMMYLGKTLEGEPVMFGASDGRPYRGKRQNGVSVFDFRMPKEEGRARFVGYGPIPGFDVSTVPPQPPTRGRAADAAKAAAPEKKPDTTNQPDTEKPDREAVRPGSGGKAKAKSKSKPEAADESPARPGTGRKGTGGGEKEASPPRKTTPSPSSKAKGSQSGGEDDDDHQKGADTDSDTSPGPSPGKSSKSSAKKSSGSGSGSTRKRSSSSSSSSSKKKRPRS